MSRTFTIVTTSFNQGEFIARTIESVLIQAGDFCIDYIIMDGGSADQTVPVIRTFDDMIKANCQFAKNRDGIPFYFSSDPSFPFCKCHGVSFRWFSAADKGQVDALKKGFDLAVGDVLCWLNSDDVYLDDRVLSNVLQWFSTRGEPMIVTGNGWYIDRNGSKTGEWQVNRINLKELLFLDYHILQPSTFFSRQVYKREYLDEKYHCAFDADFFIRLIVEGTMVQKAGDFWSAFRIYPEIKTLALRRTRFRESLRISRKYSGNLFFFIVSFVYKWFFIRCRPANGGGSLFVRFLGSIVQKSCYWAVTGRSSRS